MSLFRDIFSKYNTDKVDHDLYCPVYDEQFGGLRNKVKLLFEIGVGHGGSISGFRDYFPNAQIVGFEIDRNRLGYNSKRVAVELGDATNKCFIDNMLSKYGNPDIVIDDGSHMSRDIKSSFDLLFPVTQVCYVIEDLITQSLDFRNGHYVNDSIPATHLVADMVTRLILNKGDCRAIKTYPGICFFFK